MYHLTKGVLSPVLPKDLRVILTSLFEVVVTKGWKKMNLTKRDKSHWEHISIAHRKIQKSSKSGSSSGIGFGSWSDLSSGSGSRERGRPPRAPRGRGRGCGRGRNFVFADEHQWPEVHRRMLYELEHSMNVYPNLVVSEVHVNELVHRIHWPVDGPVSYEHWFETPDSLYVIANAFNLCVILIAQLGSTTVLPLYSYSDRPGGTLVIDLLTEQQHFIQLNDGCLIPPLHIQWIHHRTEQVSNRVDSYQNRIADWNARVARNIR
ncbi:hypothetical protein M9H77_06617 [Catharanthus roseus]|uniref:Uncharacterized protein n=1 Tax=Catharanthus roseus TaxID=4058 RepID=A0ACC0BSL0_CATRO|nr:hypothetical protein M9H77_06617 [Catharanthus roseus]